MPRGPRIQYPGAVFHIVNRGNNRQTIFADDADRRTYLALLKRYAQRNGALLHAYVLMPNHVHLLLETPRGSVATLMRGLNTSYTMRFNRRHKRVGHLFQGRYKSLLVEKENYLLELSRYIHLNPARAGLVKEPEEHPWSSYRAYIGREKGSPGLWLQDVLAAFGSKHPHQRYKAFVEEALRRGDLRGQWPVIGGAFIGSEQFASKALEQRRRSPRPARRDSFERLLDLVRKRYGLAERDDVLRPRRGHRHEARCLAMHLAATALGLSPGEVANRFAASASTVSVSLGRAERWLSERPKLRKWADEVAESLK